MSFCGFVIRKGSWEVIHNRLEAHRGSTSQCSYVTFCLMVQMQIESSNNTQLYSKQRESSNRQSFILNDFYFPILFPTLLFPSHHFSFFLVCPCLWGFFMIFTLTTFTSVSLIYFWSLSFTLFCFHFILPLMMHSL